MTMTRMAARGGPPWPPLVGSGRAGSLTGRPARRRRRSSDMPGRARAGYPCAATGCWQAGERWAARGCGDRRQRRGRCRIPLGLSRPGAALVPAQCARTGALAPVQHGVAASGAGSAVMRSSRCWRSRVATWRAGFRIGVTRFARHPIPRIADRRCIMPIRQCTLMRSNPARLLLSNNRIAQRLDSVGSLERCQERRSPPRRR